MYTNTCSRSFFLGADSGGRFRGRVGRGGLLLWSRRGGWQGRRGGCLLGAGGRVFPGRCVLGPALAGSMRHRQDRGARPAITRWFGKRALVPVTCTAVARGVPYCWGLLP